MALESRLWSQRSIAETPPSLGDSSPYTTVPTLAVNAAPRHIMHGSRLTYRVDRSRRPEMTMSAASRASRSAWTRSLPLVNSWVCAAATISSSTTTTAPIGISPKPSPVRATARASRMNLSWSSFTGPFCRFPNRAACPSSPGRWDGSAPLGTRLDAWSPVSVIIGACQPCRSSAPQRVTSSAQPFSTAPFTDLGLRSTEGDTTGRWGSCKTS